MTNAIPYWNTMVQWNDNLAGAPAGLLVFCVCIAAGYVWKVIRVLPNRFIPLIVMLTGAVIHPSLTYVSGQAGPVLLRWSVVGFIIGFAAWVFHRLVLKKIEDKLGTKLDEADTEIVIPKDNYDPKKD
jgi:hypothetical protein